MKTRILLIGGFNKTKSLASSLIKKAYHVTVINGDIEKCHILAEIEKLDVFHGDGTKPFVLEQASAGSAGIAIALTESDADNLVICELCKKKFNVGKTIAIVSDPRKTEFFYRMGIDAVVCAITSIAGIIEQQVLIEAMENAIPARGGQVQLKYISISGTAPAAGKKLAEINIPKNAVVGCVLRGEESIIPRGNTQILAGDTLIVITTGEHEMSVVKTLTGQ
ncbi:MAG: NAD-binding protein [Oscillospiraceae bacterium]|nr:NAD-binding protein [Oscillospiraceae bacterium]